MTFGTLTVENGVVRLICGLSLLALLILVYYLRPIAPLGYYASPFLPHHEVIAVESAAGLVDQLKEGNLWEIEENGEVRAAVFNNFPANLDELDNEMKKRVFLHTLLPAALIAVNEVRNERAALEKILGKIADCPQELNFDQGKEGWHCSLNYVEKLYLQYLVRKYGTTEVDKLFLRIKAVPVSLILAQGAVESSWGASRFVLEGNNIFGIWTWGMNGIIPQERAEGKNHKVAAYESLLDSVRAYLLTLNRGAAYTDLRKIRDYSMDPIGLAEGLVNYSERGDDYVGQVADIISSNDLTRYDRCFLSGARLAGSEAE